MSLRKLESQITDFRQFWMDHQHEYRNVAAKIALKIAQVYPNQGDDPSQWRDKCQAFSRGIEVQVVDHQLILSMPLLTAGTSNVVITRDVLRRWVEAGERGEDGAKRITAADQELLNKGESGMKQLLFRLSNAFYSNNVDYNSLRRHITKWARETNGGTSERVKEMPEDLLISIKAEWNLWFSVIVPKDLKFWMNQRVRRYLKSRRR